MKLLTTLALLTFLVSPLFSQQSPTSTPVEGTIQWVFDYEQAKLDAKRMNKPMFVVFRCER